MGVWISSFKFGHITINRKKYEYDIMVTWQGKVKMLQLVARHVFGEEELMQLLFERPEIIVIGIGTHSCVELSPEVIAFAEKKNVKIVDKPTPQAVKEFNELARAGKKVVAFMHLTC